MEDIDEPWSADATITDLTDTDLQAARNAYSEVSDPTRELHQLVGTLLAQCELEDASALCDRALRIEVAYAIDNNVVSFVRLGYVPFTRSDYDVAYMIPPKGWVQNHEFPERELVSQSEVEDMDRTIGFSTTPTVKQMAKQAVEYGAYETISKLVIAGLRRMAGK